MTPDEIHEWIAEQALVQKRKPYAKRPEGFTAEQWKNRNKLAIKLQDDTFANLMVFSKHYGLSQNAAVNHILTYFFKHAKG